MKGTLKGLAAITAFAALAACSDASPTASVLEVPEAAAQGKAPSASLTFSSAQSYDTETPQTSSGGAGSIGFTGSIPTGNPCVSVAASHRTGAGTVTLTVDASPNGSACIQVFTYNNYSGSITGLAAGTYTFTVVHTYAGGSAQTVHTSTVTVS